ncbi:MAG: aldose epimerase family protein [Lawsonibacter sp.]
MPLAVRRPFGITDGGEPVELLALEHGGLSCQVLTFGAAIRTLMVPDRRGRGVDVALGYDTLEEYQTRGGYFGAVVGRYANRIAGGHFFLDGRGYTLAQNDGLNHLHGGMVGFSHRVWAVEEATDRRAVLALDSPDGEEGYPGHLRVKVTYQLDGSALSIRYQAVSDRDTICNLTNHCYFNLSGHGSGPVLDQEIQLCADRYTPAKPDGLNTGAIQPVAGTPMDLRRFTSIGAHIDAPFSQLEWARGYDHNFVITGDRDALRPAARVRSPKTGIVMEVDTTMPGVQFYTANYVEEGCPGKEESRYGPRHAFCLETQYFPDSPNRPEFPSCILPAGQVFDQRTRFSFSLDEPPAGR